jgi:GAF domain-containing protein
MGIGAAAKYLGIHRSTLDLAVLHHDIIPDTRTPRGHRRFSRATLESYRAQLNGPRHRARTSGGGGAWTPREALLATLIHQVADGMDLVEVCQRAIAGIQALRPEVTMGFVCERFEDPSDPHALRLVAQVGLKLNVTSQYADMRSNVHSGERFAVVTLLTSGQAERCNDTTLPGTRLGTNVMMTQLGGLSYLLLPLTALGAVIGIMGFISPRKHAFSEVDEQYLTTLADLLAAKMRVHQLRAHLHQLVRATGELAASGLKHRAAPPAADGDVLAQRLRDLVSAYREATGAFAVRTTGLTVDILVEDAQLADLAREAAAPNSDPPVRIWREGDSSHTGTSVTIPLPNGQRAGIAAGWHGSRLEWSTDRAVLNVLAAAYVQSLP